MREVYKNWAGNYEFNGRVHYPESVAQVQDLVKSCERVGVLGSRHSFNGIADSSGILISLERMSGECVLDRGHGSVRVDASTKYGHLAQFLFSQGYALHNMASLPHISVAGACATGTHGSGVANGNLSTAVRGLEIVTAAGELVEISRDRDGDRFHGAVVALGGLGVVTAVSLELLPTFHVSQVVYENLPFARLEDSFDEIMSSAYSVSLFTDWQDDNINQVWLKHRADHSSAEFAGELVGAAMAKRDLHPIAGISAENCTKQMGVAGPWHDRLPHFRMEFTPSSGEELQSEYFVPRQCAVAALRAVNELRDQLAPLILTSEVRCVAGDSLWMSPCYQQDSVAIHFTLKSNWPDVKKLLPIVEEQLAPFNPRPHWGKLFTLGPTRLQSLYPRLADFQQLLHQYDPQGKFRNQFLDTNLFGA
jgi:xylitol oxidase